MHHHHHLCNQVVCPPVVAPGEFFVCTADVPRGSSLDIRVEMVMESLMLDIFVIYQYIHRSIKKYITFIQFDDEKNKTDTDTGWMPVPEMVAHKLYSRS